MDLGGRETGTCRHALADIDSTRRIAGCRIRKRDRPLVPDALRDPLLRRFLRRRGPESAPCATAPGRLAAPLVEQSACRWKPAPGEADRNPAPEGRARLSYSNSTGSSLL